MIQISKFTLLVIFFTLFNISCQKSDDSTAKSAVNISNRTFSVSSWSYASPSHFTNLSVPELTSDNIGKVGVMVYFSTDGNTWTAVPYTQYTTSSNYFMNFNTSVGNVQITWVYNSTVSKGSNPNDYYSAIVSYKVVIVSPTAKMLHPNLNYLDYQKVKEAFNLKD